MTNRGFSDVLIGAQYGDEGKGRVVDIIAGGENYHIIARFNGGANAGHTLQHGDKKIALHQIPSGIFNPDRILYIGSGCVVNPQRLVPEIKDVDSVGASLDGRFHISSRAALVQPHHILIDQATSGGIGTTGQGIGPAYADRALRLAGDRLLHIRVGDLLDSPHETFSRVEDNLKATLQIHPRDGINVRLTMEAFTTASMAIIPYIQADTHFMVKLVNGGKNVLFEGAQSVALDVVNGNIPFVTSSATIAGAAYVGGDLPPTFHRKTMAVAKAIMSRVGNGPFISEFGGRKSEDYCENNAGVRDIERQLDTAKLLVSGKPFEIGQGLRIRGGEYGATTGRPRRIGALDLEQLRGVVAANGVDELYVTKCDQLTDFADTKEGTIPFVVRYNLDGRSIDFVPASSEACRRVQPVYAHLPAFRNDVSIAQSAADLPAELLNVISFIELQVGCSVMGIGVGPERNLWVKGPFPA